MDNQMRRCEATLAENSEESGGLMAEFRANPAAYMEQRAKVLRSSGFEEERQRIIESQREARRDRKRAWLRKISLRPTEI